MHAVLPRLLSASPSSLTIAHRSCTGTSYPFELVHLIMGHGKSDRPFLSAAEHSGVYGAHGASSGKQHGLEQTTFHLVPYDCCALSFQPWSIPVCSPDCGIAFELTNLIPYLRKYSTHPVTGKFFSLDDIVRLNFHKNDAGKFHDPVSMKEFGEHSYLVMIRTSGNVYMKDTVERLNVKAKWWKDLISDEEFKKADIITVQDPEHPESRNPSTMHHVSEGLGLTQADKGIDDTEKVKVGGSAQKLLDQLRGPSSNTQALPPSSSAASSSSSLPSKSLSTKKQDISTAVSRNKASGSSTGMAAASFTSSSLTPRTAIDRIHLDSEELMFSHLKSLSPAPKAYVRLSTSLGPLNLELHVNAAPKTCYNFLSHCKSGYYSDTLFHRNIPGFMIQGGDPTGTGSGGESIWGIPFRDEYGEPGAYKHDGRGVISMANKGAGTNGSQFFITYRATSHLDGKHTVFGRLVDGERDKTLREMEQVPSEVGTDRPIRKIKILDALVTEDPFEKYELKQKQSQKANDPTDPDHIRRLEKRRRRENDRTTWMGTELPTKNDGAKSGRKRESDVLGAASTSIGKYMKSAAGGKSNSVPNGTTSLGGLDGQTSKKKAKTGGGGFGDFSGW